MLKTWQENHIQAPVRNIASACMSFVITYSKHAIDFNADCSCPRKSYFNVQYRRNTGMLYVVLIYRLINCSATYLEHYWCIKSSLNAIHGDWTSVPHASLCAGQQRPYTHFREKHAISSTCNNNGWLISYRGHAFNLIHIICNIIPTLLKSKLHCHQRVVCITFVLKCGYVSAAYEVPDFAEQRACEFFDTVHIKSQKAQLQH